MAKGWTSLLPIATRIVLCVVVLLFGAVVFGTLYSLRSEPKPAHETSTIRALQSVRAQPVDIHRTWEGFGTARPIDAANIPARVTAVVTEVPRDIDVGKTVKKGQTIARLDDSDFTRQVEISEQSINDLQAQLARLEIEERAWEERLDLARQDVIIARAELSRAQQAQERGAAKPREVDLAKQGLVSATRARVAAEEELTKIPSRRSSLEALLAREQSSFELAKQNLQRCHIVSPINGILSVVDVEVGENINAGQRLARVVDVTRMEVPLRLPSAARSWLAVGDQIDVRSSSSPAQTWRAHINRISPEDDETMRTVAVYAELSQEVDSVNYLPPGRFVHGTASGSATIRRYVVPRQSLQSERIWLIRNSELEMQSVEVEFYLDTKISELADSIAQWAVLTDALPDESWVVVEGSRELGIGSRAEPIDVRNGEHGGPAHASSNGDQR